ncbi:MAG: type II toxin-antitoxin system RelE/ParE family toxin [Patescibacteria group bacterium]
MRYAFDAHALKDLKKFSPEVKKRILEKLEFFVATDATLAFAERLTNNEIGSYRYRIGDYRVIFDLEDDILVVLKVGHRREIYR